MGTKKKQKKSSSRAKPEVTLTPLLPGQARRIVKARPGFEQWVETLATIYGNFADELGKGDIDIELLRSSVASYQALAVPQAEAAARHALFDDSRLVHSSQGWGQMMAIYRRAKVAAKTNGDVASAIADFERWMKRGPQKKKTAPATPVTTP